MHVCHLPVLTFSVCQEGKDRCLWLNIWGHLFARGVFFLLRGRNTIILISAGISSFDCYVLMMILTYRSTEQWTPHFGLLCGESKNLHLAQRVEVQLGVLASWEVDHALIGSSWLAFRPWYSSTAVGYFSNMYGIFNCIWKCCTNSQ